jgi:hypothetical protein
MATKYAEGKPDYSLIERDFLEGLARVMMFGAEKHGRYNWKTPPLLTREQILAAMGRHWGGTGARC